ncbi:hypothetical protein FRC05_010571 [Tulasnella sp. 425]|nr:hypothetical protein FRC05_010571 [Tulasnella sp. 425]
MGKGEDATSLFSAQFVAFLPAWLVMHLPIAALLTLVPTLVASYSKTFVVPHVDGQDDTPALKAVLANYSSDAQILFQRGVSYNIWTPINFGKLTNVEISVQGNLSYPTSIATIQSIVANTTIYSGFWFDIQGTNVTLKGNTEPQWGWVDGHGQQWWDAMNQTNRPHGWRFKVTNGIIQDMKLWKSVAWNFSLSGAKNVRAFQNTIKCISDSTSFPFNTDGFAVGGTDLVVENNYIYNGDDCVTAGNGATNVLFQNNYCEGGHGLSIGSLGSGGATDYVTNVTFQNVVMKNHLYGARFKSWTGGNGLASNITWRNIVLQHVKFPIYVTQNYWDQGKGPKPNSTSTNSTHLQNILFDNFSGDIDDSGTVEGTCITDPCWYYVPGATGEESVIFDLYPGTATNIVARHINGIRTDKGVPVRVMCDNTTITSDPGFVCQNGPFVATPVGYL